MERVNELNGIALDSNFEGFALYKTKEWTIM